MIDPAAAGAHTIGRWLLDSAARVPERTAIDDRGVRIRYAALADRASSLAEGLADRGYGPGDRIATVSGNSADHVVAFFAAALLGAALVPVSWRLTPHEQSDAIRRARPVLLLVDDEYAAAAETALEPLKARPALAMLGAAGVESRVPARPAHDAAFAARRPVRDDDPVLVIFTSGSEAAPKAVPLTHANCFWNTLALQGVAQLREDDVVLQTLPQHHIAGWTIQPLLAWWVGATVVLERTFDPARVLCLIAERGVTATMGVPTQYRLLANARGFADADLSSLRVAQVGGASTPPGLAETYAARGIGLWEGYGLTEAGPNVLCRDPHTGARGARPYPHVRTRLVDPATGLAIEGAGRGELQVAGPSVFSGYLDDEASTAAAFSEGWLRTGDLAERDADGGYRIVDRLKDIFISGGENVSPAEVEHAIARHPLVEEVAVIGVPDATWGERGVAFVVPRPGARLGADELHAHARSLLAAFKVPVRIELVAELPHAGLDKLSRARLRRTARTRTEETA